MANQIDHFMFAAASLEVGMSWAQDTFGVSPEYGGEHVGLGTRNALLSLGDVYLEIIVPDPAQVLTGTFGEQLANLSAPGLVTWAVQGDLIEIAGCLAEQGVQSVGPNRTERKTVEGDMLVWELLFPFAGDFGGRMPFFIDWLDCPHPAKTNPKAGEYIGMELSSPQGAELGSLLASLELDVEVVNGEPGMRVEIESVNPITLLASKETLALSIM